MTAFPAALVGTSLALLTYWVFSLRLPEAGDVGGQRRALSKNTRTFLAYCNWVGRWTLGMIEATVPSWAKRLDQALDRLALHADRPAELRGIEVLGLMLLCPFLTAAFLLLYCSLFIPWILPIALLVGVPLATFLPVFRLRDLSEKRRRHLRKSFPFALDLLNLCLEAGMDFTEGMKILANRCAGLARSVARKRPDYFICKLFSELLRDVQMGIPRAQALRRLEEKTGLPEIGSFATTLTLSDEAGGSVAENLRRLAAEMRNNRVMRAEEFIAKAPLKMIVPITLFLFPVVLVIIFGPVGIMIMQSFKAINL